MDHQRNFAFYYTLILLCLFLVACSNEKKDDGKNAGNGNEKTEAVKEKHGTSISQIIEFALKHAGKVDDSTRLQFSAIANKFYDDNDFDMAWSKEENWLPLADSMMQFIEQSELYGLFPINYHIKNLKKIRQRLDADSLHKEGEEPWALADIMLTDASLRIIKDLKYGRLSSDSLRFQNDTTAASKFLLGKLQKLLEVKSPYAIASSIEPAYKGYHNLKAGIRHFLDSMDRTVYTYIVYPYSKDTGKAAQKDSLAFIKTLSRRLYESQCIDRYGKALPDSAQLDAAIRKYQKMKKQKEDGKVSKALIKILNTNDVERFNRIAVTLDRYKKLPDSIPQKFIWVNLPAFYLELWDSDTLALYSKVICGKTETPTPTLASNISNMVTYPTWTVPTSIIAKQYLPKLKRNPYYLSRLGLKLVTEKGVAVDAGSINWAKYSKGIPFKVMQNSGDNNALGVLKFNFENDYAVYLHDTNQRYLFKNASRAYSHGCVRVQEWEKLAFYIARNDSMNLKKGDTLRYTTDSIRNWLAEKKTKRINVKNELPLFIGYFSCEGKDGRIRFYDDIYGEDRKMREKYFSNR